MSKANRPLPRINPNSDKDNIDGIDLENEHNFPKFLKKIELETFRQIENLALEFKHQISVISGTNRSGKSTILMALSCSHFDFQKRNPKNGNLERQTWSSLMKFTSHDRQIRDWIYYITYKIGTSEERKRGQRKHDTKKWNGIGKKESQFKNRQVVFIDLERILPPRNFSETLFKIARNASLTSISASKVIEIEMLISYVLEEHFTLNKIAMLNDKDIFKYQNSDEYSSYNAATGEEVLTKIIIDIVEANDGALILIDEVEMGLHPKVQRRLIDALYYVSRYHKKQFIVTTHSPSILSSLPTRSRNFIERNNAGSYKLISNISINAALSKMDSKSYPLVDLFFEDQIAKRIIEKAIRNIQETYSLSNFKDLINLVESGSANDTYTNFKVHQRTFEKKVIKVGAGCILDGDMRNERHGSNLKYPQEECLHFLYSNFPPEKFLLGEYLRANPNRALQYHFDAGNVHDFFNKMIEESIVTTKEEALDKCWDVFVASEAGTEYFESLKSFILSLARKYSPYL